MTNSSGAPQNIDRSTVPTPRFPIEDYLEQAGKENSLQNLQTLRSTFELHSDKAVSFVGAGVSMTLGVKDWTTLMSELVKVASEPFRTTYRSLIEPTEGASLNPEEYPRIAEELFADLGADRYGDIIKQNIEHSTVTSSPTLNALVLAIRNHLTTNFERCIENAYSEIHYYSQQTGGNFTRTPIIKYYSQATELPTQSNSDWLCYLHADLESDPPIFILRQRDYDSIYKHAGGAGHVHDCLRHFYINNHIVFLGFSFDDPYVSQCIRNIASEQRRDSEIYQKQFKEYGRKHQSKPSSHFLLIDSGENNRLWHQSAHPADYFDYWHDIGVLPILYQKGRFVFLQYLLQELSTLTGVT